MPSKVKITSLPSVSSDSSKTPPSHHVNTPPTQFRNPWPSFQQFSLLNALSCRLGITHKKNFVPIPTDRSELVKVRKPDWGYKSPHSSDKLKATWLGHASWLIETGPGIGKGSVRILLDPLFAERTSPFTFIGPKRYTPTPCTIEELPPIDVVCVSHLHYDHADSGALMELAKRNKNTVFCVGLGCRGFIESCGVESDRCVEFDWWDGVDVDVEVEEGKNGESEDVDEDDRKTGVSSKVEIRCTPAQHMSNRTPFDMGKSLWCSWTFIEHLDSGSPTVDKETENERKQRQHETQRKRTLYFAGDTGYRSVKTAFPTPEEEASVPVCPAFKQIGDVFGPVDLALLPIGLCTPRDFMGAVHCSPEDSLCVHKDIKSKRSIGMHYGTVRGGISAQYEDVLVPPRRWKEVCELDGLKWGTDCGLCDVGETVAVE